MEGHAKNAPISRLPLITILNTKHYLTDIPTCLVIRPTFYVDPNLPLAKFASDSVGFIDSPFIWS